MASPLSSPPFLLLYTLNSPLSPRHSFVFAFVHVNSKLPSLLLPLPRSISPPMPPGDRFFLSFTPILPQLPLTSKFSHHLPFITHCPRHTRSLHTPPNPIYTYCIHNPSPLSSSSYPSLEDQNNIMKSREKAKRGNPTTSFIFPNPAPSSNLPSSFPLPSTSTLRRPLAPPSLTLSSP